MSYPKKMTKLVYLYWFRIYLFTLIVCVCVCVCLGTCDVHFHKAHRRGSDILSYHSLLTDLRQVASLKSKPLCFNLHWQLAYLNNSPVSVFFDSGITDVGKIPMRVLTSECKCSGAC